MAKHRHTCRGSIPVEEPCLACNPQLEERISLYNKDHRYTQDAEDIDLRALNALRPIFHEMVAKGYSPREISHIMHATVTDLELHAII